MLYTESNLPRALTANADRFWRDVEPVERLVLFIHGTTDEVGRETRPFLMRGLHVALRGAQAVGVNIGDARPEKYFPLWNTLIRQRGPAVDFDVWRKVEPHIWTWFEELVIQASRLEQWSALDTWHCLHVFGLVLVAVLDAAYKPKDLRELLAVARAAWGIDAHPPGTNWN